jgi:hypothetical protein
MSHKTACEKCIHTQQGLIKKLEWNVQFVTLLPLQGIASKELSLEVTIKKLSKFSQSEATLTYCKLLVNQKQQLSHVPSRDTRRYVSVGMQRICASFHKLTQAGTTYSNVNAL